VTGFGIGSIMTPILSIQLGTKLAVSAVSIPHLCRYLVALLDAAQTYRQACAADIWSNSAIGGFVGSLAAFMGARAIG